MIPAFFRPEIRTVTLLHNHDNVVSMLNRSVIKQKTGRVFSEGLIRDQLFPSISCIVRGKIAILCV